MKPMSWYRRLAQLLSQRIVLWPSGAGDPDELPAPTADRAVPLADIELHLLERERLAALRRAAAPRVVHRTETPHAEEPTAPEPKVEPPGDPAGSPADVSAAAASGPDDRWLKLVEECVALVEEFEDGLEHYAPEARPLAEHAILRLLGILEFCGVGTIEEETSFDIARHQAVPPARVPQGTPLAKTLVPGLCIGNRVLRRAKVAIQQ